MRRYSFMIISALLLASPAFAADPAMMGDTAMGKVFVDGKGMTLYWFDNDMGGKSACNGPCAANWPPFMAPAGGMASGDWSIIIRDDGSKQWAYKGHPLYSWSKDMKTGDITGDGFNGKWHLAKP